MRFPEVETEETDIRAEVVLSEGGALYIHGGTTVTLTSSNLLNNIAQGGDGGSASNIGNAGGGGGGGYGGGNGGSALKGLSLLI